MKGTRKMPRCGFSNYVTQVLKFYGIKEYKYVDVLEDPEVREGIKKFSNWPTIP
jgi:monothiol glutaredoxin